MPTRLLALLVLGLVTASVAAAAANPLPTGTFATTLSGQSVALLNGKWQLRLLPGSRYLVLKGGKVAVSGIDAGTTTRVTFQDKAGPAACLGEAGPGVYLWKLTGRRLTLTPVADPCLGRRAVLSTHPLVRQ